MTVILEIERMSPLVSPMVEAALDRVMPRLRRAGLQPPTWVSASQRLMWTAPQLTFTATLTDQHAKDLPLALDFASKNAHALMAAVAGFQPVRFASVSLNIEYPSHDLPPVGRLLADYVHCPGFDDPFDAQWRIARKASERCFLNLSTSVYETRSITFTANKGLVAEGAVAEIGAPVALGLLLQIEANTKVNVLLNKGPIDVANSDLDEVLALVATGVTAGEAAIREDN